MAIVYIRQILTTVHEIDGEDYGLPEGATQGQVAEAVRDDPDAYEYLSSPYTFVEADYEVVDDPDEIASLNDETMSWSMTVEYLGRRGPHVGGTP